MNTCKICGNETKKFLDLGIQPLANQFILDLEYKELEFKYSEYKYPLTLSFCPICCMVQMDHVIPPSQIYNEAYPFFTSSSAYMVRHFRRLADLIKDEYIKYDGLIVEIGSNDGTFLSNFNSYEHVGFEPSENVARKANDLNVMVDFFDAEWGRDIFKSMGFADVIVSTNSFPHIENRDTVLQGVKWLLGPKGIWINEEAYLGSIIANTSYDQFYNEHIYTSSIASFKNTICRYGLELIGCEFQRVHGGSMRYYVTHQSNAISKPSSMRHVLYMMCQENLVDYEKLNRFALDVIFSKKRFLQTLEETDGPIVGYGATAKSTTVLNYCGVGPDIIEKIYDTTPAKQGKYSPGVHIPIVPYDEFDKDKPKNVVLFAWNHAEEIFEKEKGKDINWILPI